MTRTDMGQFLFRLPSLPISREERIRRIQRAVRDGAVTQEDLDSVLTRLLEEVQQDR